MSKDPANMTHAERVAALAREVHSPSSVAKADKMLELIRHEWREIHGMRESAAIRHGVSAPAPAMPTALTPTKAEASPEASRERQADVGTVGRLVHLYRTDERSPIQNVRFRTREHYLSLLKPIFEDCHDMKLADLKTQDIQRLYEGWTEGGKKIAMGKSLIGMLRMLANFGATILGDRECDQLSLVLHRMRFSPVEPRRERVTIEQATEIRAEAHKLGRASIALAQAFQFDCNLRQKDCVGEWVPVGEPGNSDVMDAENNNKWLRGLRWEEIDADFILTHITSKRQKKIIIDLKLAPMVMAEFGNVPRDQLPAKGPIIVSEASGKPWYAVEFRRNWRKAADAAGVPRTVFNMDSRADAISEAADARADADENDVDLTLELRQPGTLPH